MGTDRPTGGFGPGRSEPTYVALVVGGALLIPVVWLEPAAGVPARGYWDQAVLEGLLDGSVWTPPRPFRFAASEIPEDSGAVVVVPGARADPAEVSARLARLTWALVIVTSDEERRFDHRKVEHPRCLVWRQYDDPADPSGRSFPVGYAPGTPAHARASATVAPGTDWAFAGQITHRRRRAAAAAMATMDGGVYRPTEGFAQGLSHADYIATLTGAKVAPSPGGPLSPDTFRVWEALEAGAVPVVDGRAGNGRGAGYWRMLGAERLEVVEDWSTLPAVVGKITGAWPRVAAETSSWWQGYKRSLAHRLHDDVATLAGYRPQAEGVEDLVTVLVLTSPLPSHPSTEILDTTLASLEEVGLGGCETLVLCDGVRVEQAHRDHAYAEALLSTVRATEHQRGRTLPVVFSAHEHQARMTRHALASLVRTPLVMFVEGDCPVHGPIDWDALCRPLLSGAANLVRFHFEAEVHPEHRYLMVGDGPVDVEGVSLWACGQWSQRPHIARADYYRAVLDDHFRPDERHMIEDRMHSVLASAWLDHGWRGWDRHRVWTYHEPGPVGIRRSLHLDGRGDDPKWVSS